jgi:hypothetical protein
MCAGQIDVDQICKMTSLKQFTISQLPLYTAKDWATRALQNIANLMELKIFETSVVVIDNLIDIVQNCTKLEKFIFDAGRNPNGHYFTFDEIKARIDK